jgi:hypothetical protein
LRSSNAKKRAICISAQFALRDNPLKAFGCAFDSIAWFVPVRGEQPHDFAGAWPRSETDAVWREAESLADLEFVL